MKPGSINTYKLFWRWHFYAGIIFAPLLLLLAVTGAVYLFKAEIEQVLYADYYEVLPQGDRISASEQLSEVKRLYPEAGIAQYRPGGTDTASSQVLIYTENGSVTVFLNPYTGERIGELNNDERIMDKIEELHGELMAGTIGDRIVELAACWTIVLVVTGLYLWMPRKKRSLAGLFFPRLNKGRKVLRRDLHAVPAFWLTGGLLFLILTGLPWSGFWGTNFQTIVTNSGLGYPPSVWVGNPPVSSIQTKEIAQVPWAAENLAVPLSEIQGVIPLSLDKVMETANREGVYRDYTIYIPQDREGVYTLSAFPEKAQDEVTMHIDQYTGAILADYRYENYGGIGKIIAWGITLHKGTQFGLLNQVINLVVCLGIISIVISGIYLWWKRKPEEGLGAPAAQSFQRNKGVWVLIVVMGGLFPLVGLSIIAVWFFDHAVIRRFPRVRKWLHA